MSTPLSPSCAISIERVPVDEERQQLATELVFTITISPRQTAQVLKFIGQHLPKLSDIEHVKRVKKHADGSLLVVMCQCSLLSREELDTALRGTEWESLEIAVHAVPTTPPYTSEQYDLWKAVWPVSYRPPVHVRAVLSPDDRSYIGRTLRHVAAAAAAAAANANNESGDVAVAICNRQTRVVLAEETVSDASRSVHPLRHAAMCCIAQVAAAEKQRQERGAAELLSLPAKRPHSPDADDNDDVGGIAAAAAGYLCEGFDVFTSREPCVMCSMALVHSRIGRLFFIEASPSGGGISRYSIHSLKSLNHHFTAFQCSIHKIDR